MWAVQTQTWSYDIFLPQYKDKLRINSSNMGRGWGVVKILHIKVLPFSEQKPLHEPGS